MIRQQSPQAATPEAQGDRRGPDVLTQGQICKQLGICDETWRKWRARGITPPRVMLPGLPRWKASEIAEFMNGRRWRHSEGVRHARIVAPSTLSRPGNSVPVEGGSR